MVRKTKKDTEQTREAILEAAALIFAEKGVANASLDEIARQAHVTRGAVYWHFKNKADIFQALHDQLHVPFTTALLSALNTDHPCPLRQLEDLCIELLVDLAGNAQKKRLMRIFFLKCDYSGELELSLAKQNRQVAESHGLFAQYFERAKAKGHLGAQADPQTLTLSLFCYLTGIVFHYIRNGDLADLEDQAAPMMRLFFQGFPKPVGA